MKVLIALTTGYRRSIACCIVLGFFIIPACAAGQDIVLKDDFESERLSSIWSTDKLSENAIHHVSAPTRTGSGAIEIALHPYAMAEITIIFSCPLHHGLMVMGRNNAILGNIVIRMTQMRIPNQMGSKPNPNNKLGFSRQG